MLIAGWGPLQQWSGSPRITRLDTPNGRLVLIHMGSTSPFKQDMACLASQHIDPALAALRQHLKFREAKGQPTVPRAPQAGVGQVCCRGETGRCSTKAGPTLDTGFHRFPFGGSIFLTLGWSPSEVFSDDQWLGLGFEPCLEQPLLVWWLLKKMGILVTVRSLVAAG